MTDTTQASLISQNLLKSLVKHTRCDQLMEQKHGLKRTRSAYSTNSTSANTSIPNSKILEFQTQWHVR